MSSTSATFYPSKLFAKTKRRESSEVLIETFIRKQLRLKAHTVTKVEESAEFMLVHIDRLGSRLLRCGVCQQRCREAYGSARPQREWRDLSMRKLPLKLLYRPRRLDCPRCAVVLGYRPEHFGLPVLGIGKVARVGHIALPRRAGRGQTLRFDPLLNRGVGVG